MQHTPSLQQLLTSLLLLAGLWQTPAVHAQSRSAISQFNATTIGDQINLQVLDAVVKQMSTSFNHACTKPDGTSVPFGQTWQTTTCPSGLAAGTMTYICLSGYNALQSSTCH